MPSTIAPRRALLAATACLASLAAPATAAPRGTPFAGQTIFGDSLSDGGNYAILAGLGRIARFTTNPGLTAAEDTALAFGVPTTASLLGGSNYAVGGAGVLTNAPAQPGFVPTETQQITAYLATNPTLPGNRLYWVEAGANDLFYHGTAVAAGQFAAATGLPPALIARLEGVAATETPAQAASAMTRAGTQEAALVARLQQVGARTIVVVNLPDTSHTIAAAAGERLVPGTLAEQSLLSTRFNDALDAGLAGAQSGIVAVNLHGLFDELIADPAAYGIVNTTQTACTTSSSILCTANTLATANAASIYLFADGVHPTTAVHQYIADAIVAEIAAPQLVSLLGEQPLAALGQERDTVFGELLAAQVHPRTGLHLFAAGSGVAQRIAGQAYLPTAHAVTGTMTIGAIDTLPHGFSLGVEVTGGVGHQDTATAPLAFDSDTVGGTLFGQYAAPHGLYVAALVGAQRLGFSSISRRFAIGPLTRTEMGATHGTAFQTALTAGWWFGDTPLRAGPFVSLAYVDADIDGYAERGGDSSAMWFARQRRQSLPGSAGARLQASLNLHGLTLHPYAEAAYVQDFAARTREVEAGLVTLSGRFAMPGFTGDRRWGEAQGGVALDLGPRFGAQIGYLGRFAGRTTTSNGGNISVSYAF